ncbi:MAG: T9SS type A sorting domain-containing protein, partial [Flavobacterium sp.]|nr:T9SS type A sorting domain-containing protein [Flavobacterium sp.]
MKKNYFIAILALIVNFASAQIEPTTYRGAFAPAPTPMWTDSWTNWDPQNEPYTDPAAANVVNQTTNITTNTTWTTGKTYKLTGLIYVTNNATLTIQPGVIVKGVYTNTGTALIVTKGAKINAVGTATQPIVFTSNKPAGQRAPGDWGGIILLGKAGFNVNSGINNIEGITATVNTEYGGGTSPIQTDNSGTLKYCRIEFPGFVFSPNNEINGLTLGAVGSGTTIDYVQVSHSGDDSFEWFGGSVNCKHLVAYKGLDDDFDTDNGYNGIVQFGLVVRDPSVADNPSISTSEGFESDNNAGGTVTAGTNNTSAIFTNCTLIGPKFRASIAPTVTIASGYERALRLRRATELKVFNSIFLDFKSNILFIDGSAALANATATTPKLIFKNNTLAGTLDGTYTSGFNLNASNPTTLPTYLSSNTVQNSSTNVLTKAYGTSSTEWAAGNLATTSTNLDYRPVSSTGADFTDSSMTPYITAVVGESPIVSNRTYCKGDVATPLTATLTTTGVSLKWYNAVVNTTTLAVSVSTLIATGAPTPVTTTAGVKYYYVSQVDNLGSESAKVQVSVTVNAIPTEVLAAITGTNPDALTTTAAITEVGKFVGTTSSFTYTTSNITEGNTYLWTVPNGVNITNGQGTATITVNYANVPAGAGTIGSINVQSVNSNGCKNAAKTLTITKALPAAPATLVLTNRALPGTAATSAITNFGNYMGQSTALTLTAAAVATASAYEWELPTGVNLAIPNTATTVTTTNTYTAEPFLSPNTPGTTIGTKFWTVTKTDYTHDVNGVTTTTSVSTAKQNIVGTGTITFTITAGAIGINQVNTLFTYNGDTYILTTATTATSTSVVCAVVFPLAGSNYPLYGSNTTGNLTKVSDGSTIAFSKIAVTQGRTYTFTIAAGQIGVKSAGSVFTYNGDTYYLATATTATSTSVVCYVADPQPAGNYPSGVTTNTNVANTYLTDAITEAKTYFSKIVKAGYQATTSQSYLPYGTKIVSNKNSILVKFDGVTNQATAKLYLGVKSVNGVGASVKSNATNTDVVANNNIPGLFYKTYTEVPTAPVATTLTNLSSVFNLTGTSPSTALLLTLSATVPAAPTTLVLSNPAVGTTAVTVVSKFIGKNTTFKLTAAASALASSYLWELPNGVNRTDANGVSVEGSTSIDPFIYVNFENVASATTSLVFGVKAVNGRGSSSSVNVAPNALRTDKLLTVTSPGVSVEGLTSTDPFIYVNFANVLPAITSLVFGVKAVNGVGSSSSVNVAPNADRTAKLLTVTATIPAAPATLTLTDGVTATAITVVSKFIGTDTIFKLTAAASVLANSYLWELPVGVNRTDASGDSVQGLTSTEPFIFVNFENVPHENTTISLVFGVKAVNGVGSSSTKPLTVTAGLPSAVATVGGSTSVCNRSQGYDYTITAPVGATEYTITAPVGSTVSSVNGVQGATNNILTTTDLTFKVVYSGTAAFPATDKTLSIRSGNVFGPATTAKAITLTKVATCPQAKAEMASPEMVSEVSIYPNPARDNFNLELTTSVASEMSMTIYSMNGATVRTKNIQLSEGNNVINEDISSLANGIYFVRFNNPTNNE